MVLTNEVIQVVERYTRCVGSGKWVESSEGMVGMRYRAMWLVVGERVLLENIDNKVLTLTSRVRKINRYENIIRVETMNSIYMLKILISSE